MTLFYRPDPSAHHYLSSSDAKRTSSSSSHAVSTRLRSSRMELEGGDGQVRFTRAASPSTAGAAAPKLLDRDISARDRLREDGGAKEGNTEVISPAAGRSLSSTAMSPSKGSVSSIGSYAHAASRPSMNTGACLSVCHEMVSCRIAMYSESIMPLESQTAQFLRRKSWS